MFIHIVNTNVALDQNQLLNLPLKLKACPLLIYSIFFISMFILLTCRKASEGLYIKQAITLTCFWSCQDIIVQFKFFILVF